MKKRIPKRFGLDPVRDIQVLCPMNRGGAGAQSLNLELQSALNSAGQRKVARSGWTFAPGDKVMQIENNYDKEVYNGDIGQVVNVDPETGELAAHFEGSDHVYGSVELDALVRAHAGTMPKSQGSEYPAVIVPVLTQHYAMLRRNLLYTGVTRGKRLVVLAGQEKAVAIAVRNVSGRRRWSKLDEWLGRNGSDRESLESASRRARHVVATPPRPDGGGAAGQCPVPGPVAGERRQRAANAVHESRSWPSRRFRTSHIRSVSSIPSAIIAVGMLALIPSTAIAIR